MKTLVLVTPGLEEIAAQELQEQLQEKAKISPGVLEFSVSEKEKLLRLPFHLQSARRALLFLAKRKEAEKISLKTEEWISFLPKAFSFKVEVENVSGQENRFALAGATATKIFDFLEKEHRMTIDLKKPQFLFVLYFTGKEYFLGLDLCGQELNTRGYRLFPHSATFKGDLAYYFLRTAGFSAEKKLLALGVKDGTLAIEAALFAHQRIVLKMNSQLSLRFSPWFSAEKTESFSPLKIIPENEKKIIGVDEGKQNITAAIKNSQLAGVKNQILFKKVNLEELENNFSPREFELIVVHLTLKDEPHLNEIFYQTEKLLAVQGILCLLTGPTLEINSSQKLILKKKGKVSKGESHYHYWILEKKEEKK